VEVLKALPARIDGFLLGWPATIKDDISQDFATLTQALGLKNLRFHDLRHEAISRLFERGWSVAEVAAVSGHKTWTQLRRYTQIKPGHLVAKLDQPTRMAA
jgi:integrase